MSLKSPDGPQRKTLRERIVERTEKLLRRRGSPRLQMFFFLSISGLASFLASFVLLHLGMTHMWLRYPLAVGFGYMIFLLILWQWLWYQATHQAGPPYDPGPTNWADPGPQPLYYDSRSSLEPLKAGAEKSSSGKSNGGSGFSLEGGDGDGVGILVLVIVVVVVLSSLIILIYSLATAPTFLAELLVDGVILTSLSAKKPRPVEETSSWFSTALRTWWAAVLLAVIFALAGWGLEQLVPGAHTMGEAWHRELR